MTSKRRLHCNRKTKRDTRSSIQQSFLPARQMPEFFKVLDAAIDAGLATLSPETATTIPADEMRLPVLDRAVMHLQAAQMLLKECHWESAAVVARQLFEFLVNIEEIVLRPNSQAAWEDFTQYGIVSAANAELKKIEYAEKHGYPADDEHASALKKLIATPPFDTVKISVRGWSGKSIKAMSTQSRNPDRKEQHRYYYSVWSDQVHSNPSALLRAIGPETTSGADERIRQSVYRETRSLIVMLVTLFCDLIDVLGAPRLIDEGSVTVWRQQLQQANEAFVRRHS